MDAEDPRSHLPRDQDGRSDGHRGVRQHPPIARTAAGRARRPDPAPLGRGLRRSRPAHGLRWGAGGSDPRSRRRARRRDRDHRTRDEGARGASRGAAPVPVRHGPHPVQLPPHPLSRVPARLRSARRGGPRAGCRADVDQGRRPQPLESRRGTSVRDVVRAARRAGSDRCGDGLRARPPGSDGHLHRERRAPRPDADPGRGPCCLDLARRGRGTSSNGFPTSNRRSCAWRAGSHPSGSSRCSSADPYHAPP